MCVKDKGVKTGGAVRWRKPRQPAIFRHRQPKGSETVKAELPPPPDLDSTPNRAARVTLRRAVACSGQARALRLTPKSKSRTRTTTRTRRIALSVERRFFFESPAGLRGFRILTPDSCFLFSVSVFLPAHKSMLISSLIYGAPLAVSSGPARK